jgi:hypothetical protein
MVVSHVGLAIFNPAGFPTQWVLVLSRNELFQGRVLCSTVGTTVNGWQQICMECEHSPASFNRAATFAGVIHIAALPEKMDVIHSDIKSKGIVSTNPAYTDRYALQALRRIGDKLFGPSSFLSKEKELYEAIRARVPLLIQSRCTSPSFPIASLSLDGVRVGKSN